MKQTFRLDETRTKGIIKVDADGVTVRHPGPSNSASAILSDTGFSSGIVEWQVKIIDCESQYWVATGVVDEKLCKFTNWSKGNWYCVGSNQECYRMQLKSPQHFHNGDTMLCKLDMEEGTFEIRRNTKDSAYRAFVQGLRGKTLWPCIALHKKGNVAKLIVP